MDALIPLFHCYMLQIIKMFKGLSILIAHVTCWQATLLHNRTSLYVCQRVDRPFLELCSVDLGSLAVG